MRQSSNIWLPSYFSKLVLIVATLSLLLARCVVSQNQSSNGNKLGILQDKQLLYVPREEDDNGSENTLLLGAMLPVHGYKIVTQKDRLGNLVHVHQCHDLQPNYGIQAVEAFLYTLDKINNNASLLPGITLGGLVLDSCNSPQIALRGALKFIKGILANENKHNQSDFVCPNNTTPEYQGGKFDKVVGVVGEQRTAVSEEMANVFKLFEIPQISYLSTSASLSQQSVYPYFLRTVPSDSEQAEVILRILKHMGWKYASLVYSANTYGESGHKELMARAGDHGVCFAHPVLSIKDDETDERLRSVARTLINNKNASVIVVFADKEVAVSLLKMYSKLKHQHYSHMHGYGHGPRHVFVGSDSWTNRLLEGDIDEVVEDCIGVQPLVQDVPGFDNYFLPLRTSNNNTRNVWFDEYKRQQVGTASYRQVGWIHFLQDAVYAFAHGLHRLWLQHCNNKPGVCEAMTHDGHLHGHDLLQQLKNVSFIDASGRRFQFDGNRSGIPRYTVFQFQHSSNIYSWVKVANYSRELGLEPTLLWFKNTTQWSRGQQTPTSQCSEQCTAREEKRTNMTDKCCWDCKSCLVQQFLNRSVCITCKDPCDKLYTNDTECSPKPDKSIDYKHPWVLTACFLSLIGIVTSACVAGVFWLHLDTPVIKAASRELSLILLVGILMSFSMTFVVVAPQTEITCGITRFFLGFSYTLCYAAILTKTNRIARIFKSPSKLKTRFTSPQSQLIIVSLLLAVEVAINVSWLLYIPPAVIYECDPKKTYRFPVCVGLTDSSYIVGHVYPLVLVFFCTVYAIKTRKCPGGFNESRYIAFTNYTTSIIWLVFVPLYLTRKNYDETRIVSLAMFLSLGGIVHLGCLFLPKVHLVLFKPEKNTSDAVMSQHSGGGVSNGGRHVNKGNRPHQSAPAAVLRNDGGNNARSSLPSPDMGYSYNSLKRNELAHYPSQHPKHATLPTLQLNQANHINSNIVANTAPDSSGCQQLQPTARPLQQQSLPYKTTENYRQSSPRLSQRLSSNSQNQLSPTQQQEGRSSSPNPSDSLNSVKPSKLLLQDDGANKEVPSEEKDGQVNSAYMSTLQRKK